MHTQKVIQNYAHQDDWLVNDSRLGHLLRYPRHREDVVSENSRRDGFRANDGKSKPIIFHAGKPGSDGHVQLFRFLGPSACERRVQENNDKRKRDNTYLASSFA